MGNQSGTLNKKWLKGVVVLAAAGFAFASIYQISQRKKLSRDGDSHGDNKPFNLGMERYVFDIAKDEGTAQAVVERAGDCYSVQLDGKHLGTMWQEEHRGMQWETQDKELEPFMWEIAVHLSEAFSRKGFPAILMGTYPEILSTNWKTSETLEVNVKDETDLEVFTTFLKDEILNLVTFEEHLDLMVKKENESYFVIVGIN